MRILFLSFYFEPDLCAGSFRASALVKAIKSVAPNIEIHVVTTKPNRYYSSDLNAPEYEFDGDVSINRIALPSHRSGILDQANAFIYFCFQVLKLVQGEKYDLIFATSSRLMTAYLAAFLAWRKNVSLYLDIRDIFVDTIKDVLPLILALLFRPVFDLIENWTIQQATRVNLVSEGFREYFEVRYPQQRFSYFTNGIDEEFLTNVTSNVPVTIPGHRRLLVLYAGNLGEGQGLHMVLPELAKLTSSFINFRVFGDGGRKKQLLRVLEESKVSNVEVLDPVSRSQLISEYGKADILLLHLNSFEAFEKVIPSKIFEYGASGKPIWAGVQGYPAEFIRKEIDNIAIFPPCDSEAAVTALSQLIIQTRPRLAFINKYSRVAICCKMAVEIVLSANEKK